MTGPRPTPRVVRSRRGLAAPDLAAGRARRRRRGAVALVTVLASSYALPTVAQAAPTAEVVATATETAPGGRLVTSTIRLDPAPAATRAGSERPGWEIDAEVASGTQQIGLTWSGDPQAQFTIRARAVGAATWTSWSGLEGELAEGPDAAVRPGAGPLWFGAEGIDRVQVRLVNGLVSDVRVDAMAFERSSSAAATRAITIARPAMAAGGPPIRLRSSWTTVGWNTGGSGCGAGPTANRSLRTGIVHHTDGSNSYAAADVPGILAGIRRFHTVSRGWCDIGYNLFVDRFGAVWEGRAGGLDVTAEGGHAMGFNGESVGIALLGQFQPGISPSPVTPPAPMLTALRDVLAWKLGSQGLDPRGRVRLTSRGNPKFPEGQVADLPVLNGHRDSGLTSCPGELLYRRLPQLRLDVAARVAATNIPSRWAPHGNGARYVQRMIIDAENTIDRQSRIGTFTSQVVRAGIPQGELTATVILSPRADARIGLVDRLYRSVFGRNPDSAGLRVNVIHRDQGMSERDLVGNFLGSGQFSARYGAPDDAAFTGILYRNALGRSPSAADTNTWVARLRGGLDRRDMVLWIIQSAEARSKLSARTRTTMAWFAMLRRAPSAAELTSWSTRLASGSTNKDLVVTLLRSAEYLARYRA